MQLKNNPENSSDFPKAGGESAIQVTLCFCYDNPTMTNISLVQHLWAKSDPYHPLWCHLLDVAAVCRALLPRFGGVAGLPDDWLLYLVALHDVGKADAQFQIKIEDKALIQPLLAAGLHFPLEQIKFRHEARSAAWIDKTLRGQFQWSRSPSQIVCRAITGHHGDFQAVAYLEEEDMRTQWEAWHALREELAAVVRHVLHLEPFALNRFTDASAAGMKLSGLIVLSDWIASNPETYRYSDPSILHAESAPDDYWIAAQAEGRTAVRRLELDVLSDGREPGAALPSFAAVWPGMPPRPVQAALETALNAHPAPGLLIIEAPMGEGKTEAALYVAECWGRSGAYIALPTQATSNQMHTRYARFLERRRPAGVAPRLVHGMAWLMDDVSVQETAQTAEGEERLLSREWFANAKRALLAGDGVGTVDQVLMAALNVKHGFLRFLGLTTKTLIIDECHAYDLFMTTLMQTLLKWCRALNIPVILLSATLSQAQKQLLADAYGGPGALPAGPLAAQVPYPLLTFIPPEAAAFTVAVPADPNRNRIVTLRRHHGLLGDAEATAQKAAQEAVGGGCVCVLVNTVGSAQRLFRALQNLAPPDTELFLYHARFRAQRRQEIEAEVLARFGKDPDTNEVTNTRRPARAILVATQVAEQSLDIDLDVMFSEIAPIDLLLQRSGRLWRHDRAGARHTHTEPILHLLLPPDQEFSFGGTGYVYEQEILLRTLALLQEYSTFTLPADFRPLIEACYGSLPPSSKSIPAEIWEEAAAERRIHQAQSRSKALVHLVPDPSTDVFSYAETRDPETEGEDGERASFFRAQTREGDNSRAALILHDPTLIAAVKRGCEDPEYWPGKTRLRAMFLQKAALPTWWLFGVQAAEGYELITNVPKWVRHHTVLPLREGEWHGVDGKGRGVVIRDDALYGLERIQEP